MTLPPTFRLSRDRLRRPMSLPGASLRSKGSVAPTSRQGEEWHAWLAAALETAGSSISHASPRRRNGSNRVTHGVESLPKA